MSSFVVHLIRHGEVENPDRVVYASLPGFGLSATGRAQASATAEHLGASPIGALVSSPLRRAVETATIIGARLGVNVQRDERAREWDLGERWAGTRWTDLDHRFPGELSAYLEHPHDLSFGDESLAAAADRIGAVITDLAEAHPGGEAALVSHQDPIQAARLALTGRALSTLQQDKPGHGSVVTLARQGGGGAWHETRYWEPAQGVTFPPPSSRER